MHQKYRRISFLELNFNFLNQFIFVSYVNASVLSATQPTMPSYGALRELRRHKRPDHPHYLTTIFKSLCTGYSPYSEDSLIWLMDHVWFRCRPRSMSALQCLGLIVIWTRIRGKESFLCMIFGISDDLCSIFLRFARHIIIQVLQHDNRAKMQIPNDEKLPELQHLSSNGTPVWRMCIVLPMALNSQFNKPEGL